MAIQEATAARDSLLDPISGEEIDAPVVIYHAPCPDGFCAALAAWLHFDGRGDYIPMSHDQTVPDVTGRTVYMLDIAFDVATMERVERQAERLVVLDHHQSTADNLSKFEPQCGAIRFDMSKSAAKIAWEVFHPGKPIPDLITHVEDRDLLQWMVDGSDQFLMALDAGPYNFYRWAGILRMPDDARASFMQRGRAMRDMANKMASELAIHASPIELNGQTGLMANASYVFHNDVGAHLAERSGTYAAIWCVENDTGGVPRVRVGLRSKGHFDVIPIAQAFGGGGHPNSSAFRLPISQLQQLMSGRMVPASQTHVEEQPGALDQPARPRG